MTEHLYQGSRGGDVLPFIVLRDQLDGFGGVRSGAMWCWSHAAWEPISAEWREQEKRLREEFLSLWDARKFNPKTGELAYGSGFAEIVRAYCGLVSWKVPDVKDVHQLGRLAREIKDPEHRPWDPQKKRTWER